MVHLIYISYWYLAVGCDNETIQGEKTSNGIISIYAILVSYGKVVIMDNEKWESLEWWI